MNEQIKEQIKKNESPTIKKIFDVAENYRPLGRPIMTSNKAFDDAMDGGIRGGELIVFTGSKKQGKTSYVLWLTKQICDSGVPCLWFSYEMNPWYLKEKLLAIGAKEDLIAYCPMEHNGNTIEWLEEKITEAQENFACKVIFIDHLHYLVSFEQEMKGNTSLVVGAVARKLKQLAIRTDSIVVLVAHARYLRDGERINSNAIRDSALIGNEADYIFTVERLLRKERKFKTTEEVMKGNQTNYSKVALTDNRRTGLSPFKLFEVDKGRFKELAESEVEQIKDDVVI